MPSLNWIGKEAVVNHDKEVPFRLLKKIEAHSVKKDSQNLVIHGDNLEALKALMPHYYGKVKCIYIDPPYNTGNEGWVYNDKVNSPKIRQWLGKVVGREAEDLTRHDKWLCMMYPRLKLLRELLSEDGVIFVSIDEAEQAHLKLVLDEIFDENNKIAEFIVVRAEGGGLAKHYIKGHDYLFIYAKNKETATPLRKEKDIRGKIVIKDGKEFWLEEDWLRKEFGKYGNCHYEEIVKYKGEEKKKEIDQKIKDGEYILIEKTNGLHLVGRLRLVETDGSKLYSVIKYLNAEGSRDLEEIKLDTKFDFPKPVSLVKFLVKSATFFSKNKADIILDSFAGSGTTGQAVLELNREDGGNRKFILIELEDSIAKNITAERIKRIIKSHDHEDGFEYCELDKPLFNEKGQIEETCDFNQFATYIYFTETQKNIDKRVINGSFIGEDEGAEFYLIYEDPRTNDLSRSFIKKLKKTDNRKVVYADRCLLDEEQLLQHNIVFKQIPYEVKVY
jgi:adenine-specific DNA-methyltransferase